MFGFIGKVVARFWPIVLTLWAALLVLGWLAAPDWEAVTRTGEIIFLPADSPSLRGDQLFQEAFPEGYTGSSIALVLRREGMELTEQDRQFIEDELAGRLEKLAEDVDGQESIVGSVRTLAQPGTGALLVSPDGRATLVVLELSTPFVDLRNYPVVARVEGLLAELRGEGTVPEGLDIAVTGSATAGRDLTEALGQSVVAIETWTVVVVVVLLLLLYRAPLLTVIPLLTVYVAIQLSIQLLSLLGGAGLLAPDRDVRIFITVLAYGAGVDYCLFLIARYREELTRAEPGQAVASAIGHVGAAITASAATVIFGVGMLAFARFGKIQQAGLTIPLALAFVLCATLTFTPALLRAAGRWAFWPRPVTEGATPGGLSRLLGRPWLPDVWERLSPALLRRPGAIWLVSVAMMAPFVAVALWRYNDQNFNPVSDLPAKAPSAAGARAAAEHFPPGALSPITVLLHNDGVHFGTREGRELVRRLTDRLGEWRDELGLVDVRSVARPLGITPSAEKALASLPRDNVRQRAIDHYVSPAGDWRGHVTRIDLILHADPFSRQALGELDRIEAAVRAALPAGMQGSRIELSGPAASARDLAAVKHSDQGRIQLLVPAVVFVLLVLILWRVVISLYLVLSVLFSYLATLGVTFVVFQLLEGDAFMGLDWRVPIFLFTILVAVGEDYNILLVTRIQEEQRRHGPLLGITTALVRTGRVISACGFIMAGTFAALLSASLVAMKQLGFALALGILLDTLVVRPVLVPAFLILLQSGQLGPLGRAVALADSEDNRMKR